MDVEKKKFEKSVGVKTRNRSLCTTANALLYFERTKAGRGLGGRKKGRIIEIGGNREERLRGMGNNGTNWQLTGAREQQRDERAKGKTNGKAENLETSILLVISDARHTTSYSQKKVNAPEA